jgi:hypothetical protein
MPAWRPLVLTAESDVGQAGADLSRRGVHEQCGLKAGDVAEDQTGWVSGCATVPNRRAWEHLGDVEEIAAKLRARLGRF